MVFSSTTFMFLFLPLCLVIYYNPFFKGISFRNHFLFLASLGFYAWGEPIFVVLLIFSICVTWFIGLFLKGNRAKAFLIIGVTYNVFILFIFKYLTFLAGELGLLIDHDFGINISLPIGISFFTFQLISYLFDVYYSKAEPQKKLLYVGLYVALFPQLIAGPIVRYGSIEAELRSRAASRDDIAQGTKKFIYGLGKKVLLANYFAQIADVSFDYLAGKTSVAMVWLGAICYTLQIYFDFSGYSDMAIGLGRIFGFHFEENFNYPYISKSITEFWRRWHISLSTWFRDYVYIPMGGSRCSKSRNVVNLLVVWLLTGIWHGANWTFLLWGLLFFVFLIIEKNTSINQKLGSVAYPVTVFVVVMGWVLFRSANLETAILYVGNMFGLFATSFVDAFFTETFKSIFIFLVIGLVGSTPLIKHLFERIKETEYYFLESVWVLIVFSLSILQVVGSSYNPFIYFNF